MLDHIILCLLAHVSLVVAQSFIVQLAGNTSAATIISDYSLEDGPDVFEKVEINSRFRALIGEFSADLLRKLQQDSRVAAISFDRWLELQEFVVQGQSPVHLSHLASTSTAVSRPFVFDSRSGSGVDVYLFDTGIDFKHPGLGNVKVRRLEDCTSSPVPRGSDPHGHGTALAGLIASETFGVLKRCDLIDVRIADEQGKLKVSQLLLGLSVAAKHASRTMKPSVFAIPIVAGSKNYVLESALQSISGDVALVLPAGNQQSEACDFTALDNRKAKNVLVVGSVDEMNHVAPFSNYGECVDVYTSGIAVRTLQSTDVSPKSLLRSVNGTSASCAIGAGVVGYYMSMGLDSHEAIAKTIRVSQHVSEHPHYCKLLQLEP